MKGLQRVGVVQSRHSKAPVYKNVLFRKNCMICKPYFPKGKLTFFSLFLSPRCGISFHRHRF